MVFSLLLLLCSPRCITFCNPRHFAVSLEHVTITSHVRVRLQNGGRILLAVGCSGLQNVLHRGERETKQRKHHRLAQLIKVINTVAILFVVISELTKFRTIKCLGHLHIVRMPLH